MAIQLRVQTLLGIGFLCWPADALAHRICFRFPLEDANLDASPREPGGIIPDPDTPPIKDAGETYGRTDGTFPAIRMLVRIKDNMNATLWGWAPVDFAGCTGEFDAKPGDAVSLERYHWAYFPDGTGIATYDCWTSPECLFEKRTDVVVLAVGAQTNFGAPAPDPRDATFWATVFSTFRRSLAGGAPLYSVITTANTVADRGIGGWPTANYRGPIDDRAGSDSRKFTLAHEWGHLQTILASTNLAMGDIDYGFTPDMCSEDPNDPNYDPDCMPSMQHTLTSLEYQPAASVEGFAQWYAMSVWNDESQAEAVYIKAGIPKFFSAVLFEDAYVPMCSQQVCPAGMANEMDWAFALWEFEARQVNPDPTPFQVGGMLASAHPWPDDPALYWNHFLTNLPLPQPYVDAWVTIGGAFAIDQ